MYIYMYYNYVVASQPYFKTRLACETNRELERSDRDSDTFTRLRMENQLKVAVELHEGEKSTKKIWRFNADLAAADIRKFNWKRK